MEAGTTYQFDQAGPNDAFLYLRDSSGNLITYDDQSGGNNDAQIIYTATESGTYYLDAAAYVDAFTGTYTLSSQIIGTVPIDDYAGDTSTTGVLEIGGSINGALEDGSDTDWFQINLTQSNTTYQFELIGAWLDDYDYEGDVSSSLVAVSYTHLTLPTKA